MKFTHPSASALHSLIRRAAKFCDSKRAYAAPLNAIRFIAEKGRVHVLATDLDNHCDFLAPGAVVVRAGDCATTAKALLAALKGAGKGAVTVEGVQGGIVVRSGAGESWAPEVETAMWPSPPDPTEDFVVADGTEIGAALRDVARFAATDSINSPNLCGVRFESERAVAIDGFRLGWWTWRSKLPEPVHDVTINAKGAELLGTFLADGTGSVMVRMDGSKLCVWARTGKVWAKRVDDPHAEAYGGRAFPDYDHVIPKRAPVHVRFNAGEMRRACDQLLKASAGSFNHALFVYFDTTSSGAIDLLAGRENEPAFAIAQVNVELPGAGKAFWCNARFMLGALAAFGDRSVELRWERKFAPIAITCPDLPHVYRLIMLANFQKDANGKLTDDPDPHPLKPGEEPREVTWEELGVVDGDGVSKDRPVEE